MKCRIHQNIWGNWNGCVGNKKAVEFGTSESDAQTWLENPEKYESERYRPATIRIRSIYGISPAK